MSPRLLKVNVCSLYKDLKTCPKKFFRFFRMSNTTFDKLLVLLGPSLKFQDTRMRNCIPPKERLAVTLREKKTSVLFLIHFLFIIVLSGIDPEIQNVLYESQFCLSKIQKFR
jgi:hypothetical protein